MFTLFKIKPGFTLIELLVIVVIIGVLATLTTIGLSSVRSKARDAKRISDIKQMQTALELFFSDENSYPTTAAVVPGSPLISTDGGKTYMKSVPSNPQPQAEGACSAGTDYSYSQQQGGLSYNISYCLAKTVSGLPAGAAVATPKAVNNVCAPSCGGKYCGDANGCGGVCGLADGVGVNPVLGLTNFSCNNSGQIVCGSTTNITPDGTFNTCSGSNLMCNSVAKCGSDQVCPSSGICVSNCPVGICGDCSSTACGSTCVTSVYNGSVTSSESYGTVQVGSQCWMTKNITNVGVITNAGVYSDNSKVERWCPGPNGGNASSGLSQSNCDAYGALYAWNEAMYLPASYNANVFSGYVGFGGSAKRQGICPRGWHIPSDREVAILDDFLDVASIPPIGDGATCDSANWGYNADNVCSISNPTYDGPEYGTNSTGGAGYNMRPGGSSGMNIPYAGYYDTDMATYNLRGTWFFIWTSSQKSAQMVYRRYAYGNRVGRDGSISKHYGQTVRCIKD